MDRRVFLVLGFLCATTSGFIPHLVRRGDVAAQTNEEPDAVSVERLGDQDQSMYCLYRAGKCHPIRAIFDSLFSAKQGRMFVVDNQLKFSCSAETKENFEVCASAVRRNCTKHTNWIDSNAGFYYDLCAMESVLLDGAACMNSEVVSSKVQNCLDASSMESVCRLIIPCIRTALNSDSNCSQELKTKFIEAITAFRTGHFGANCELSTLGF